MAVTRGEGCDGKESRCRIVKCKYLVHIGGGSLGGRSLSMKANQRRLHEESARN